MNSFKKSLFLIICVIIGHSLFSQNISIRGKVLNIKEEAIPYVNIGIASKGIGTSSNEIGQFELKLDRTNISDTISVSSIGYKTSYLVVSKFFTKEIEDVTIYLSEHHVVMKEVSVTALDENAEHIVQKALEHYYSNYSKRSYQLEGFYRELVRNDDNYVLLTEALTTIDDKGYHKQGDKKIRLDALRKSNDMRTVDSLDIHYDTLGESNDLSSLIRMDYIDAGRQTSSFSLWPNFSNKFIESFDFLLDSLAYHDDHLVYCLSFYNKNQKYMTKYEEHNSLIVRTKDYAVVEMRIGVKVKELTETEKNKKGSIGSTVDGGYYSKQLIQYQQYKGKWYPKYISRYRGVTGGDKQKASRLAYDEARKLGTSELNLTNQSYKGRKIDPNKNNYFAFSEILITSVKDKKDKYTRVKTKEIVNPKAYIRNHNMVYDKKYWSNKNVVLMNPFLKQAKKHLEAATPLEIQFEQNSNPRSIK